MLIPKKSSYHVKSPKHMKEIRRLPCLVCGGQAEAHHLRHLSQDINVAGRGKKNGDNWTIPLCHVHHRSGGQAIHAMHESEWEKVMGIDPQEVAEKLWDASPEFEAMERVVRVYHGMIWEARMERANG